VAVKEEPSPREQGEGHGTRLGAWSGRGGTSRRMGRGTVRWLCWELGRPSSARSLRGPSLPSSCETASAVGLLSLRARTDVLSCRSSHQRWMPGQSPMPPVEERREP
jgi:hypothetical protein